MRGRAASAGWAQGGRQVSRWTVKRRIEGRAPGGLSHSRYILNSTRMPVPEAKADQAVETNRKVPVKVVGGLAEVVPDHIYRAEWLNRGGPPDQKSLMCERDDNARVYVDFTPSSPGESFGRNRREVTSAG
jgi:hypothetical protein